MKNSKPSIGLDTNGQLFCKGCGKAGFKTKSHAYGHTGVCRGIEGLKEALGGGEALGAPSSSPSPSSPLPPLSFPLVQVGMEGGAGGEVMENYQRVQMAQMQDEIARLKTITTNHVSHLSGQMGGFTDFFSSNAFKWVLFGIAAIAAVYLLEKGDSKTKQKIGTDLLGYAMKKI